MWSIIIIAGPVDFFFKQHHLNLHNFLGKGFGLFGTEPGYIKSLTGKTRGKKNRNNLKPDIFLFVEPTAGMLSFH